MKSPISSLTIWGILTTAAGTFGVPAADPSATTLALVLQLVGILLSLVGRWRKGDLALTTGAAAMLVLPLLALGACATSAQPQQATGKGNEVYMPVAGWKAAAKTHDGDLGFDPRKGEPASMSRVLKIPFLNKDGQPVYDMDGKPLFIEVNGNVGDLYFVSGDLDGHQEIQVPGTNTTNAQKTDSSTPTNTVSPPVNVSGLPIN